jgi:hypothetical protein
MRDSRSATQRHEDVLAMDVLDRFPGSMFFLSARKRTCCRPVCRADHCEEVKRNATESCRRDRPEHRLTIAVERYYSSNRISRVTSTGSRAVAGIGTRSSRLVLIDHHPNLLCTHLCTQCCSTQVCTQYSTIEREREREHNLEPFQHYCVDPMLFTVLSADHQYKAHGGRGRISDRREQAIYSDTNTAS